MDYKKTVANISSELRLSCLKRAVIVSAIIGFAVLFAFYAHSLAQPPQIHSRKWLYSLLFLWLGATWFAYEIFALGLSKKIGIILLPKVLEDIYDKPKSEVGSLSWIEGYSISQLTDDEMQLLTQALKQNLLNSEDVLSEFDLRMLPTLSTKWQAIDIIRTSNFNVQKKRQNNV